MKNVTVPLSDELLAALRDKAEARGRTLNEQLRIALRFYVASQFVEQPMKRGRHHA
ncbi:hypothetical protein CLI64_11115 [Nostoc sp. CENA543]|uniref:ribbon-helix-helix domain-containing protein n=1 Tax=Nostoc sp. CENA543 TaxID=1869241 RepID=UPI000CA1EA42|nr:CopG family transcriptional regulator [Nostoc sp. CENA543]AUT00904.1 hypothetical protein CLI64_11115 [Nostoc sp. CENA543]